MPRRLATIDLGIKTVRVLVVEANAQNGWPLYQSQRVTGSLVVSDRGLREGIVYGFLSAL